MKLIVTKERRFTLDGNDTAYTDNELASGYHYISRYLDVFDGLTVVGRARVGNTCGLSVVTGPGVDLYPVTHFHGPGEYLLRSREVRNDIRRICADNIGRCAFITRSPGRMSSLVIHELSKAGYPYAMEVVGDPYDVYAPGAISHPLRPYLRWKATKDLKRHCAAASAVAYVTERSLQRRYPPAASAYTTNYSSLQIDQSLFASAPRSARPVSEGCNLVTIGMMSTMYKGIDDLLKAFALCCETDHGLRLSIIGDGNKRSELQRLAGTLGLSEKVVFLGQLPAGKAVLAQLDKADLFVLASKQEGLPRAMIEAMARGLPCIGSSVGGIPELLEKDDLFPPGDIAAIARKITEVANDPQRRGRMATRALCAAQSYRNDLLQKRRIAFYEYVHNATLQHLGLNKGLSRGTEMIMDHG